ncbi:MAG: response regulator [Butyrivibrio sp.]|nr:response regulator [Butyrivibrio sp.]
MTNTFGELIKNLRNERQISQQQLADMLYVNRSSVANWENGRRIPDLVVLSRLIKALNVDASVITNAMDDSKALPEVVIIDDETILLKGAIGILSEAMPEANITGFSKVTELLEYAKSNRINIAFVDIELGKNSGLELCRNLLEINPMTNVIFLTNYSDYALNAWQTEASGFLTKPLHLSDVQKELSKLRHPVKGL